MMNDDAARSSNPYLSKANGVIGKGRPTQDGKVRGFDTVEALEKSVEQEIGDIQSAVGRLRSVATGIGEQTISSSTALEGINDFFGELGNAAMLQFYHLKHLAPINGRAIAAGVVSVCVVIGALFKFALQ
eukprot:GHVH01010807.1.p1 GENE.GHVH01010807.1~~GHVH01010807.1.p1  ORF type:complete len:130 (-),score=6.90 GHVH01010807.1:50-439(-)